MYKVVIVDDEWWTLQGIKKTFRLKEMNFEIVLDTTNSQDAFDYILENEVDVVLTDIRMPGLSGIDLLKKTRSRNINIEFIIISGYAEFDYAQEALRGGAFDYCLKPIKRFKADEILEKLSQHLEQKYHKNKVTENSFQSEDDIRIDNNNFKKLIDYMKEHYQEKIYLKDLSNKFGFNSNYSCHLFNKYTNSTFSEYLTELRMNKAVELLTDKSLSIQQIGDKTGYNDYYYFTKVFKKYYNMTPTEYRKTKKNRRDKVGN